MDEDGADGDDGDPVIFRSSPLLVSALLDLRLALPLLFLVLVIFFSRARRRRRLEDFLGFTGEGESAQRSSVPSSSAAAAHRSVIVVDTSVMVPGAL